MSENEARARELARSCMELRQFKPKSYQTYFTSDDLAEHTEAFVKEKAAAIAAALEAAGRRERIAGLREAAVIAGTMAERPYDSEPEFSAVLAVEAAISARITALEADTPANRGEG